MQMTLYFILFKKTTSLTNLKKDFTYLQKGFYDNPTVLNPRKCYYMTFGSNTTKNEFVFENGTIVPSAEEHLVLGITTYSRLTLYSHLKKLCKKVAT